MENINEILRNENLGELPSDGENHAYGVTDKGMQVWLPQLNDNEYWKNVVLASDEVIVQLGLTQSDFQWQAPQRRLSGKYRPVYHNKDLCLTIHANDTLPIAQGTTSSDGAISWLTGFAATAEEAREKEALFRKKARLG